MDYIMENWPRVRYFVAVLAHVAIMIACLSFTPKAHAETHIIPIQDLIMEVPNFDNRPDFSINNAIRGQMPIGDLKKDKPRNKKAQEKAILDIINEMYPDCDVRIWRGNLIVTDR